MLNGHATNKHNNCNNMKELNKTSSRVEGERDNKLMNTFKYSTVRRVFWPQSVVKLGICYGNVCLPVCL